MYWDTMVCIWPIMHRQESELRLLAGGTQKNNPEEAGRTGTKQ